MNTVYVQGEWKEVTSALLTKALKSAVKAIGEDNLGIKADTVGTHYIRAPHAMFPYIKNSTHQQSFSW